MSVSVSDSTMIWTAFNLFGGLLILSTLRNQGCMFSHAMEKRTRRRVDDVKTCIQIQHRQSSYSTLLIQHKASSEEEYGEVGPELHRNITARSAKGFFGSFFSYQLHTKGLGEYTHAILRVFQKDSKTHHRFEAALEAAKEKSKQGTEESRTDLYKLRGHSDTPDNGEVEANLTFDITTGNAPEDSVNRLYVNTGSVMMIDQTSLGMEAYKMAGLSLDLNEGISSISNTSSVLTTTPTMINVSAAKEKNMAAKARPLASLICNQTPSELQSIFGAEMMRFVPITSSRTKGANHPSNKMGTSYLDNFFETHTPAEALSMLAATSLEPKKLAYLNTATCCRHFFNGRSKVSLTKLVGELNSTLLREWESFGRQTPEIMADLQQIIEHIDNAHKMTSDAETRLRAINLLSSNQLFNRMSNLILTHYPLIEMQFASVLGDTVRTTTR